MCCELFVCLLLRVTCCLMFADCGLLFVFAVYNSIRNVNVLFAVCCLLVVGCCPVFVVRCVLLLVRCVVLLGGCFFARCLLFVVFC